MRYYDNDDNNIYTVSTGSQCKTKNVILCHNKMLFHYKIGIDPSSSILHNSITNSYVDNLSFIIHVWCAYIPVQKCVLLQVALPWFDKLEVLAIRVHPVKHPHISIAAIVRMHKVPLRVIALKSKVIAYPGRDQPKHVAVMFGWRHAKVALTTSVATNVVSRLLGGVKAKSLSEWTSRFLRSEQKDSLLLERENRV